MTKRANQQSKNIAAYLIFRFFNFIIRYLIPFISVFLAIVDGWLVALEGGFVNPLQAFLLIEGNTIARHVKPADGKLCLGITAISRLLVPESTL
jgi:hypothetical protein